VVVLFLNSLFLAQISIYQYLTAFLTAFQKVPPQHKEAGKPLPTSQITKTTLKQTFSSVKKLLF